MKNTNLKINFIKKAESLARVHTHTHTQVIL